MTVKRRILTQIYARACEDEPFSCSTSRRDEPNRRLTVKKKKNNDVYYNSQKHTRYVAIS